VRLGFGMALWRVPLDLPQLAEKLVDDLPFLMRAPL
jgi:hypothetical protein